MERVRACLITVFKNSFLFLKTRKTCLVFFFLFFFFCAKKTKNTKFKEEKQFYDKIKMMFFVFLKFIIKNSFKK